MNQLTDDVKTLKDAGFISIARQYARMARKLKEVRKFAKRCEFNTISGMAADALGRFEK